MLRYSCMLSGIVMAKVFLYWDNSNIFISAREVAKNREGKEAYGQVRIDFEKMHKLAIRHRETQRVVVVGSVPPETDALWNKLRNMGIEVKLLERGQKGGGEQGVDETLQLDMLRDAFDNSGDPGIAVLLSGDGAGFADGCGFHAELRRMHDSGWRIEILSWRHSCKRLMRNWAEANGHFVELDRYYDSVTFLQGSPHQTIRASQPLPPLDP